jgi:glycine/D-amino acid oxidase-like deaminating enzyme
MLTAMLARVFEYMPALRECSILRTWTGFRAATPDKQPLIGHYRDRLYVATGHEGLGVTTSMGTARMLAAMVEGKEPPLSAAPYDPWRFHGL